MRRSYEQLSAEERGVIMAMKLQGASARAIATALSRAPSGISRELRRNGYKPVSELGPMGRPRVAGGYNAQRAGARARRLRRLVRTPRKLGPHGALWPPGCASCSKRSSRPSRWPPGSNRNIPRSAPCKLRTRASTRPSTPPRAGRCAASSWRCCARAVAHASPARAAATGAARSRTW